VFGGRLKKKKDCRPYVSRQRAADTTPGAVFSRSFIHLNNVIQQWLWYNWYVCMMYYYKDDDEDKGEQTAISIGPEEKTPRYPQTFNRVPLFNITTYYNMIYCCNNNNNNNIHPNSSKVENVIPQLQRVAPLTHTKNVILNYLIRL